MPRTPRPQIDFVAQPVEGAPGAANSAAVVVIAVPQLRFSLVDAAGARVGQAYLVTPAQGRATWRFTNPAPGVGYRVSVEDATRTMHAIRSSGFDVVKAAPAPLPMPAPAPAPAPLPSPAPAPPPGPALLSISTDPAPPVVGRPATVRVAAVGVTSAEWVAVRNTAGFPWVGVPALFTIDSAGAGSFAWTPALTGDFVKVLAVTRTVSRDGPMAVSAPVAAPPVVTPPGPAAVPAILSIAGDMASARVGQPSRLTIRTQGLAAVEWVVVRGDGAFTWRTAPAALAVPASGEAVLDFVPQAGGEFVKVMAPGNPGISRDGPAMPGAAPVPAAAGGDAGFAFAWRASLKHGLNIERGRAIGFSYQGKLYRDDPGFFRYLLGCGVNYVRLFYPWDAATDMLGDGVTMNAGRRPPLDKIKQFVAVAVQAARAGMRCWIDMTDVAALDVVQKQRALVDAHFTDFCREVAAQPELTPDLFVIGAFNELVTWAGEGTNAQWNPVRMETHALIRRILPKHLIVHGGANWCNRVEMCAADWQTPPDALSIASFHHYMAGDMGQGFWRGVQGDMDAFERRHGIPIVAGEGGDDAGHSKPEHAGRWAGMFRDIATAAPRTKQCWWCVTNPGWGWSMLGEDGKLLPDVERALRDTAGLWATT